MKFQIIFQTSRKVTIEFLDFGIYFTEKKYRLLLNGKEILTSDRVVQTISGLLWQTGKQKRRFVLRQIMNL